MRAYSNAHYLANKEEYLERSRLRRLQNKEETASYQKQYRKDNKDRLRLVNKKWVASNKDKYKMAKLAWDKRNPGKVNAKTRSYKAAKANRRPSWLSPSQKLEMQEFYILAKDLSWLSLEPSEVDHIVPLRGALVSGLHVPWNLQILPKSINGKKRNTYD